MISSISTAKQVIINIDGFFFSFCHGNVEDDNKIAINVICFNILVLQKIDINFLTVIDSIPQLLQQFFPVFSVQTGRIPGTILIFCCAQDNDPAVTVCKGRIGFSQRIGKSAFRLFYFTAVIFFVGIKFCYIK